MQIEVDKKGLGAALAIAGAVIVILVIGNFVLSTAREIRFVPSSAPDSAPVAGEPADDNSFYLEPPAGKPVFLSKIDVAKKRDALMWEKRDFILTDLDGMSMTLYASGTVRASFPIAARPEQRSLFAPPSGFYTIQGKAERHVSKIIRGGFSWAVYLYGNYLIHAAVPRLKATGFAAGAKVSEAGIELASEDAKQLFQFSHDGMPVLVSGGVRPQGVSFTYFRKTVLPHSVPEVSAASMVAADLDTGEILFEKNKNDAFPIASVSKLLTALVVEEHIPSSKLLVVGNEALHVYGNAAGLLKGEIFSVRELLYSMILSSSNNAAKMFELAVPDFMAHMNEKAHEIGMFHASFKDSSGLSQDNVASAGDLFMLLKYLDAKHPEILALSRETAHTATSQNKLKTHVWVNINWPQDDKRFLGGKTGFTDDSLQTMAGIYRVRTTEYGGRKIGIVVLGSRNRVSDIRSVISYLEKNYVYGFAVSGAGTTLHPIASGAAIYEAVQGTSQ